MIAGLPYIHTIVPIANLGTDDMIVHLYLVLPGSYERSTGSS